VTASNTSGALTVTSDNFTTSFTVSGDTNALAGLGLTANTFTPGAAGVDTWNLFYLSDSAASGANTQWTNVGQDYIFGSNGALTPQLPSVVISNLAVNGVGLGDITLNHGANGLSQFADTNGTVQVTDIDQNGFPTGQLSSIAVSDEGRVQGVFTNGKTIDLAEIATANFQSSNNLAKLDGGAFAATSLSGVALAGTTGRIISQALESSNSDIAEEFSKLVVTQQAYAAGTRIVSTSNEMLQEALNMVR
jgi:flagellar hook protein FlgE